MVKKVDEYNSDSILSLSDRSHLVMRLNLTMGDETGDSNNPYSSQKTTAIREVLDNALDEIRAGYGSYVKLSFFKDGSIEVKDSGRGIPVDSSLDANGRKVSGIFKALGIIRSGGKFSSGSNSYTSGLNGVGASSTVHLSKCAIVKVYRHKKVYELHFKDGEAGFFAAESPDADFELLDKDKFDFLKVSKDERTAEEKKKYPTGTTVKVWLRDEVFQSAYPVDVDDLINRFKNTAYLVPELKAEVYNEFRLIEDPATGKSEPQTEFYHFENGLEELLKANQTSVPIVSPIYLKGKGSYVEKNVSVMQDDGTIANEDVKRYVPFELMMSWGNGYSYSVDSYVNTINTKLGGSHEEAFQKAVTEAFNERFSTMRGLLPKGSALPVFEDFSEGLTAVLSVQISEPSFTSQTKERLGAGPVKKAIADAVKESVQKWIADKANTNDLQIIAQKVVDAAKARQKAKERRDNARKANQISSSSLPVKLLDCEKAGSEDASLYICEGDSALSSLKAARNSEVDALLPVRGKLINVYKSSESKALENAEIQDIIKTLGAGVGSSFNIDNMRYGKVFIAVDADPDGNDIACLLYTIFWTFFRDVVLEGRLFKIETPLFVIKSKGRGGKKFYAQNEVERDKILRDLDRKKVSYTVSRLKGLGEVDADTLEETAINPETRVVTQILVDDVERNLQMLDTLFGKDTEVRKNWVMNHKSNKINQ